MLAFADSTTAAWAPLCLRQYCHPQRLQDAKANLGASQQPLPLQGADSVEGYFPSGKWYSLFDNSTLDASGGGRRFTLQLPLGEVGVHVKVNG